MAALSPAQLADLCRRFLGGDPVTGYAIARAESGGDPLAIGDGGASIGLWQINLPSHPQYTTGWLLDPTRNAIAAQAISGGGVRWLAWCTWEPPACNGHGNGRYRAYLAEARAALAASTPPAPLPSPPPASRGLAWLALGVGAVLIAIAGRVGRPRAS